MAVKTITIDIEAYEALRRHRKAEQSFSEVIKEHFGKVGGTARDLLSALNGVRLSGETLDAIDLQVRKRRRQPLRIVML